MMLLTYNDFGSDAMEETMTELARCPQWWAVFSMRGDSGTYEVLCDDPIRGGFRCSCKAWIFGGRTTCKHIDRLRGHGCFGSGPNDLDTVHVEITGENPNRATIPTGHRCACGEMMLAPLVRTRDDAGHQIVQVAFDTGSQYTYAWGGRGELAVGDVVHGGTVATVGSDWAGPVKVIGEVA